MNREGGAAGLEPDPVGGERGARGDGEVQDTREKG